MKILLITADKEVADWVRTELADTDATLKVSHNSKTIEKYIAEERPDTIIDNIMVPYPDPSFFSTIKCPAHYEMGNDFHYLSTSEQTIGESTRYSIGYFLRGLPIRTVDTDKLPRISTKGGKAVLLPRPAPSKSVGSHSNAARKALLEAKKR